MARSIIGGLVNMGRPADTIRVSEPDAAKREHFKDAFGIDASADNADVIPDCGTLILAVKPQMMQQVLDRLKGEAETRSIRVYSYGPCTWQVSRQDWLTSVDQTDHHVNRLAAFRSVRGGG